MRAAVIVGLGCSLRDLKSFQQGSNDVFEVGLPACAEGLDAVLIFGGDGTVHRHLGALARLGLPVLVVPAGSGNDFARALGLLKVRDSRQAWREFTEHPGRARAIDLGVITALGPPSGATHSGQPGPVESHENYQQAQSGISAHQIASPHYFACVGGIGLDAEIARRANRLPRWLRRRGGYAMALPASLARFTPFSLKLSTACGDFAQTGQFELRRDGPAVLAAFANTPFYGDGMKIAPRARLDDGAFDVCLIEAINRLKLLSVFPSVYFGRHLGIQEVKYFQATAARVETEHPLDVYADGEFVCRTPAEFRVAPRALRVITPWGS
jgi:diacylglycerol kinase (ATP)